MFHRLTRIIVTVGLATTGLLAAMPAGADEHEEPLPTGLPIIYVHGGAGSAAQYRTQQMRFASNGYPNVIAAIDRPTGATGLPFDPLFDEFIDDVLDATGDDQVFVLGHSLGTFIMNGYLNSSPERAARIAKYISIDGAPANCGAIPTVCINITAAGLGGHGHTQAVTSPESFVIQHEFLTGQPPTTTAVLQEANPAISGRVINFPDNFGPGEGTLRLFEIDSLTGHRTSEDPVATFDFTDEDDGGTEQLAGAWGPVTVDPTKRHEFELTRAVSDATTHYYMQSFTRSTDMIRLLTAPPDAPTVVNTEVGPDHAAAVVIRYKEWWGNLPDGARDSLKISTTSTEGPGDPAFPEQHPVELINAATAPGPGGPFGQSQTIGIHVHDVHSDGVTDTDQAIPFFLGTTFQTGVDVHMPATEPVDGTIQMVSTHRGDVDRPQVINTPNWSSTDHRILVEFNDYLEEEMALPIVFVHGASGSAAQYQSQAMRFASNDYPNLVTGIDRISAAAGTINPILDDFFDDLMANTGDSQLYVVGHSQGVAVMNNYLNSSPERSARVAKYIGIDSASGLSPDVCPGNVPCKGIWARGDPARALGPFNNVQFENQGHTQAVVSPESFAAQHGFFTGAAPATTDVEPEANPTIGGRLIDFPANTGPGEGTLNVWEVDGATGHRTSATPYATFEFTDADDSGGAQDAGAWGPLAVDPNQHYEFEIDRSGSEVTGHFYREPFVRSNHLVRLLIAPDILLNFTDVGPDHSSLVAIRYKEWWADHPLTPDDNLQIGTSRPDLVQEPPVEVVNPAIAPVANSTIGIHVFDSGADQTTDLSAPIPFFFSLAFQSGADVFMPASDPPDGTITLRSAPRDTPDRVQMINVPNWESETHRMGVELNDFAPPLETGTIAGRVLDAGNQALPGAHVRAYLVGDVWVGQGHAVTADDGTYSMEVPPGQYRVLFQGPTSSGWVQEWWHHSATRAGAPHVLVTPGGSAGDVDAKLSPGGWVTGTVTDPEGEPVEGATVWVYSNINLFLGTAATTTRADGTYDLGGIPQGFYRVMVRTPEGSGFAHQWWNGQPGGLPLPERWSAPQLFVDWNQTIPNIDAQLAAP